MGEKKLLIDGLRFTYSGMFDIYDFFKEVDKWTDQNGFERETKKKGEYIEADSKKMEYIFELWKNQTDYARTVVRLKALFRDVVEFDLQRGQYKRNMQKGKVLIIIDGFLEQELENRWTQKPWYFFIRAVYDKLVWRYWTGRLDGAVLSACHELFNTLHTLFKRYKY